MFLKARRILSLVVLSALILGGLGTEDREEESDTYPYSQLIDERFEEDGFIRFFLLPGFMDSIYHMHTGALHLLNTMKEV